ncbi:LysR family transcriptional regulator [Streptomyces sp. ITFR-16]|uniref:LysR family transcriptional regulator n=1 Tax=Streptomyces sp. ITFR-16 TaxID=3075198 RepID=UPI002889E4F2|nr:LysR family transcriptional regulator [Streptomyces sp. ITFR-16]WNI27165.1 LysR family transcriptional regulator [Streptomyces sp. ITFR-16]
MPVDLRKLSYFVAVAQSQSYVRAAAELHITQPALSRQIQALERSLRVTLFTRDRRGTVLTEAGRQLLEDAVPLLASAVALERRVRAAARTGNEFTVGFMPGVPSTALLNEFRAAYPDLSIHARYVPIIEQEPYLLDGTVDISFVWLPLKSPELQHVILFDVPRVAAISVASPLARLTRVSLEGLCSLPSVDGPDEIPGWRVNSVPLSRPLAAVEERLEAVAAGEGFCILPASVARYHRRDDVATVEIQDMEPAVVALAYTRHRTMPEIQHFATMARLHLGSRHNKLSE